MKKTTNKIYITGMGAVTPLGCGVNTYWSNLIDGVSGIAPISRFDASNLPVRIAGEVTDFDPNNYMTRKQSHNMELFMQFGYAAAEEALKDARIIPDANGVLPIAAERIGIVVGTVFAGIIDITETQAGISTDPNFKVNPRLITRIIGNVAAAQVAIEKGFKGPSLTLSTACSSGLDTITTGQMLINEGLADAVLCIGAEAATCPETILGLSAIHALSTRNDEPEKASRPFDVDRDGFVIAEGGGCVIIESEESVVRRNATPHAILAGCSNLADGYHVTRPHPDGLGAIATMEGAINQSGISTSQIGYVNAHGTSTPMGDAIEVKAIKTLFKRNVATSATKASTGHLMGAAGSIEAIACIKALETGILPPTINQDNIDPACDIDTIPNIARAADIDYAICNAFGFGGQNASVLFGKVN